MKNLKKVTCPRCKGYGYIRGQRVSNGSHLRNYKHVEGGRCFACEGAKVLHMREDGKLIREANGTILHYSKDNGVYLGILENKNKQSKIIEFEPAWLSPVGRLISETEEKRIKQRENKIQMMILDVYLNLKNLDTVFPNVIDLTISRYDEYCKLLSENDKGELIEFSEIVIPILQDTVELMNTFKEHGDKKVEEFITIYKNFSTDLLKTYKTNLDNYSFNYVVF